MVSRKREKKLGHVRTVIDEPILPEEEGDDPFKFALREFGDEEALTLHVYRYDPMTGKPRYAKSVPFQKETHGLEWLQRMFGAGEYLLRFYDSEGNSKNRSVSVDDDPSRQKRELEAPSSSRGNDELVSVLREQNTIFLKALLDRGTSSPAAATESPVTLKILDALLPQALSKPDTSGALLSMLEKGITIAMEAKSEGEGGTAGLLRTVVKELGPAIQEFARARMMAPPPMRPIVAPPPFPMPPAIPAVATPPPSPAPPPTSPAAPAEPALPDAAAAEGMVNAIVQGGFPVVERAWREKEKPQDVADWILGEIPPNYYEHLAALSYERLTTTEPRYGAVERPWLEEVLSHIREGAAAGGDEDENAEAS